MAPQWWVAPPHLETTPGMHRFVWPLRYAPPPELAGRPSFRPRGVWAPPGDYTVTLTVDGRELTRGLTVVPDPRVDLDPADYQAELELARKVEALQAEIAGPTDTAGKIQGRLTERRATATGELAAEIDAFQAKLIALRGITPAANPFNAWAFPPQQLESLRWVDGALGSLMEMVDGADAAPSPDALTAYAELEPRTHATLDAWNRFLAVDVQAMDAKLRAVGLAPVGGEE
jgi:hypothetical protein